MPAHAQTSTAAIVAAGRHLLEERGMDALTMRDVADAVGVRAPSLYKRVRGRADLFRLILEDVADELTAALDAAAGSGDPVTDLRAMAAVYRRFAHSNPVTYTLLMAPQAGPDATARSVRSSATLLRVVAELAGQAARAARGAHDRGLGARLHLDGTRRRVPARRRRRAGLGLRPGPGPDRGPPPRRRPRLTPTRGSQLTRPGSAGCSG